jgi:membrane-bound lytic murein transglycosylase D
MIRFFLVCFAMMGLVAWAGPLLLMPEGNFDDSALDEVVVQQLPEKEVVTEPLGKWAPTDFTKQPAALGYAADTFTVPKGFEDRVQFWIDIYTKYTMNQGVLHDSRYVNLVYQKVDFQEIDERVDLTEKQKERERRKYIKGLKVILAERIKSLDKVTDSSTLSTEDKRLWDMFAKIDDPKKFTEAARKGRLRFQLGQQEQFINGIYQSGRYLKQMEEIFRQEGLPIELTRLPFVESSFNLKAHSRVGASGIWQFMRTAARYYLRRDGSADQRNDPLLATRAAAKMLRGNFKMLEEWPLAVTAYNHGPSGVKRLTKKFESTDIVELTDVRRGRFGFASANFYASFLAALIVEKDAKKYFGDIPILPELKGIEMKLEKPLALKEILKFFNGDMEMAKTLNPHIEPVVWSGKAPLQSKQTLRVPLNTSAQAKAE